MKKIICLFLVLIVSMTLFAGCSKNEEKPADTTTPTFSGKVETFNYYVDPEFKERICFEIPTEWKDKFSTTISSSSKTGYYSVSGFYVAENGERIEMFTIYCSSSDAYKKFESRKNYEILHTSDKYTFIWYEVSHNTEKFDDATAKEFKAWSKQLNTIKKCAKDNMYQ